MGKIRSKTFNNIRNVVGDSFQCKHDTDISDYSTTISERYKRKNLRIHAHVQGGNADFCAIFEYAGIEPSDPSKLTIIPTNDNGAASSFSANDLNKPVLVSIINLVEPIERIGASVVSFNTDSPMRAVPSYVWLQPLNRCLMFLTEASNLIASSGSKAIDWNEFTFSVPSPPLGITDTIYRKLGERCGCMGFGILHRELIDQAIECRPQVMSDFPDKNPPFGGWGIADYAKAIQIISRISIYIRPDDIITGISPKGLLDVSQSLNFTFCTVNLEARAFQLMHMLKYPQGETNARKETEDTQRPRNTRADQAGRVRRSQKGGRANQGQALNYPPPPEVAKSQTAPCHPLGDCTAKHTRLGSPEDA